MAGGEVAVEEKGSKGWQSAYQDEEIVGGCGAVGGGALGGGGEVEKWNPLGAIIGFTASVGLVLPLSPSIWSIHSMEIG